jgi:hypothetical protein
MKSGLLKCRIGPGNREFEHFKRVVLRPRAIA